MKLMSPEQLVEKDKFHLSFGTYVPPGDVCKDAENHIMYGQAGWFTKDPVQLKNMLDLIFKDRIGDVWKVPRGEAMAEMVRAGAVPNVIGRVHALLVPVGAEATAVILQALKE